MSPKMDREWYNSLAAKLERGLKIQFPLVNWRVFRDEELPGELIGNDAKRRFVRFSDFYIEAKVVVNDHPLKYHVHISHHLVEDGAVNSTEVIAEYASHKLVYGLTHQVFCELYADID